MRAHCLIDGYHVCNITVNVCRTDRRPKFSPTKLFFFAKNSLYVLFLAGYRASMNIYFFHISNTRLQWNCCSYTSSLYKQGFLYALRFSFNISVSVTNFQSATLVFINCTILFRLYNVPAVIAATTNVGSTSGTA